jgi:hypothetical protein
MQAKASVIRAPVAGMEGDSWYDPAIPHMEKQG